MLTWIGFCHIDLESFTLDFKIRKTKNYKPIKRRKPRRKKKEGNLVERKKEEEDMARITHTYPHWESRHVRPKTRSWTIEEHIGNQERKSDGGKVVKATVGLKRVFMGCQWKLTRTTMELRLSNDGTMSRDPQSSRWS